MDANYSVPDLNQYIQDLLILQFVLNTVPLEIFPQGPIIRLLVHQPMQIISTVVQQRAM